MLSFRRLAVSSVVAALLVGVAAPRAGAQDGDKKESRSVWDRVTGAVDDVTDWALPGDSIADKAWAIPTGRSPFSPPVNLGNADDVVGGAQEAQRWVAEQAGRAVIPGYSEAMDFRDDVTGAVDRNVPGGMRTVGIAGLIVVLLLLWKLLMPPAVQAGKAAVASKVPGGAAAMKSRPAPARRTETRHRAAAPSSKSTWAHSGRPGKADVVSATSGRLVVCADGEDQAMAAARRRWQGWRVRATGTDRCELGPDKLHVHVSKVKPS